MGYRGFGVRPKSELEKARERAKNAKIRFNHEVDVRNATCGLEFLKHISPSVAMAADEFNLAWAEVERLDPNLPEHLKGFRL